MTPSLPRHRNLAADLIRVLAMCGVILMHTTLNFTIRPDFFNTPLWWLLEPVMALAKTAVLLFLILSGYLVISKQRSPAENLKRVGSRLLIPLFIFEVLTIACQWTKVAPIPLAQFAADQGSRLFTFPSSPLWFLEVLVFLYLLNPAWQTLLHHSRQLSQYFVQASLGFTLLITLLAYLLGKPDAVFNTFTAWTGFVVFFLYGGYIKMYQPQFARKLRLNVLVFLAAWIVTIAGDWFASQGRLQESSLALLQYTGNYLSVPVTLLAITSWNILLHLNLDSLNRYRLWANAKAMLLSTSQLSFGVYLIHVFVVSVFTDVIGFDFNRLQINVYIYNILNPLLVLSISLLLTFLIRRIPWVRMMIGESA